MLLAMKTINIIIMIIIIIIITIIIITILFIERLEWVDGDISFESWNFKTRADHLVLTYYAQPKKLQTTIP